MKEKCKILNKNKCFLFCIMQIKVYFCVMEWKKLISNKRFGQEHKHAERHDDRSEFKRDYDRLIFSSAFRRLQNKTQVFPLPGSIFVHNRLTHSLEVASVGMSLGNDISRRIIEKRPELKDTLAATIPPANATHNTPETAVLMILPIILLSFFFCAITVNSFSFGYTTRFMAVLRSASTPLLDVILSYKPQNEPFSA